MKILISDFWIETSGWKWNPNVRFDPATAGLALTLGGTGLGAIGQLAQAQTTAGIDTANAQIMNLNAQTALQQGKAQQAEGMEKSRELSEEKRKMIGAQTAAYGGSGIDPGVGTPLKVMADTYGNYERDIQMTGYNTDVALQESKSQADIYKYQGDIYSWAAGRALSSGYIGAGTTLLGGVGQSLLKTR